MARGDGLGLLKGLFRRGDDVARSLYDAVVALARQPHWYVEGAVPDTLDGRFDMVAAILSIVLLRLDADPAAARPAARLTERFIADMDAQMRQIGFGDMVVGKHVGRLVAALGGRLGAYRDGLAAGDLEPALARNLYRGNPPSPGQVRHVADAITALHHRLAALPLETVIAGTLE